MFRFSMLARLFVPLVLLTLGVSARADEKKIPLKDVPKAALGAIKVRFPDAELKQSSKETEDGKTTYEVGLKQKSANIDVTVTAEGKIVEVERSIAAKDLPKAVASAIEAKYPRASIKKAEEIVEFEGDKESKSYEVVLATAAQKTLEVKLSPPGKILEEENR